MSTDVIGDADGGLEKQVEGEVKEALSFDRTGDPATDAAINDYIRQPRYHVVPPDGTELVLDTIEYVAYKKLFPKMLQQARQKATKRTVEQAGTGQLDSRLAQLAQTADVKQQAQQAEADKAATKRVTALTAELIALMLAKKLQNEGWNVTMK